MRQNEVRATEHNNTPSRKARQPGRHKSNQIPRGRDQRKNWTRTPQGTNRRGKGSINRQGRGANNSQTNDRKKEAQPPTKRGTTTTDRCPKPRRQKHRHNAITAKEGPRTRGSKTHDQGQRTAGRAQPRSRPLRTNPPDKTKKRGATRGQNPTEARKRIPTTPQQVGANRNVAPKERGHRR